VVPDTTAADTVPVVVKFPEVITAVPSVIVFASRLLIDILAPLKVPAVKVAVPSVIILAYISLVVIIFAPDIVPLRIII